MVGGRASRRSQISVAFSGGASGSSSATSPPLSTQVEATGRSQPAPGCQSGCSNEISRQLDHMRTLGVNEVELEMRSAGGDTPPPWDTCDLSTLLGPTYPQPTETQLNGLRTVLALVQRHGMRAMLILNNTHMDEQPPVRSQQWLAAILGAVKDSPAL